eukprot:TRINITY_DN42269_c0_g1_i1.p1 TRINITY_DN42269_c0_g1~~TRINITY_DN42269_c0_g1_i1.p1  ORF type:complete len:401 (-),score=72.26 TRINITY_DN42269_c0_g1_i1:338-1540(-)
MSHGSVRSALLCLIYQRLALAWDAAAGKGWQKSSADPPWLPHAGSLAAPLSDGSILLIGGQAGLHGGAMFDCFECMKEVWRFEPSTEVWSNLTSDVPWDPRWGHSVLAAKDDAVWMFFGCCEVGKPGVMFTDIWTFNPTKGLPWRQVDAAPPFEGIQATSMAAKASNIWLAGGWSQSRGTLSLVAVFNTKTLGWKIITDHNVAPWPTRADHGSAISPDGSWLFIFGGQHEENGGSYWVRLQDTWRVRLTDAADATKWEKIGDLTSPRSSPALSLLPNGWLITLGGHVTPEGEQLDSNIEERDAVQKHHDDTFFKPMGDMHALNLNNAGEDGWRLLEGTAPWPARDDCAAVVTKDTATLLLFGGGTLYGGGGYHRDVWKIEDVAAAYALDSTKAAAKADEL